MKKFFSFILFILIGYSSFSQTQSEMNEAEHKNFLRADQELNQVYKKILNDYKEDSVFIKNFKVAQRIWIQFRDAEMNMMYPEREAGYYGSIHPMCWSIYLRELTNGRIKKLKQWVNGEERGNSCSPSIKFSQ